MAREYRWGKQSANALLGKDHDRVDGLVKASGQAKYTADTNTNGTLYCGLVTSKVAHGTIENLDISKAETMPGVKAVHVFNGEGKTVQWDGMLIAAVAAETEGQARDACREIEREQNLKIEPLDHWVNESDLEGATAAERTKDLGDDTQGDPDGAAKAAKVVHEGDYGIATITHMCMEPHGAHAEWAANGGDELTVHLSTQNVSGTPGQFAGNPAIGIDAGNVEVICQYLGGGFGSKFAADEWGIAAAVMARKTGRPVRLMLDRATELKTAGNRPSGFAKVKIAANDKGEIVSWDSHHWGTDGIGGSPISGSVMPYVFDFPNRRRKTTGIVTNCGPKRAWRAPNHPQGCALTGPAIDDVAAKLGMDSYEVFKANLQYAPAERQEVYAAEMEIGAKLIDWKEKWHPHGKGPKKDGVVQGLGMAIHTWGGRAHGATTRIKVHPDGAVETFGGSQDIGTGTRTAIAITVAETLGLDVDDVKVNLGTSKYPRSGPSGGSTTIGGVSGPNRRAALDALWHVSDLAAKKYGVEDATSLVAKDGKLWSNGKEVCTWKQACALLGPMPAEFEAKGPQKDPDLGKDPLNDNGVAGVQMADVSVDTETGVIRVNKLVAVQDTGLIINLKAAKSQVYGALIMGIAYALSEERIMDDKTGRFLNADLVNYKLPHIGDIGELVVEMYEPESEYERGVIGLGEPPVISTGAALSNAVCNALGVRVPTLPMTPDRVIYALKGGAA